MSYSWISRPQEIRFGFTLRQTLEYNRRGGAWSERIRAIRANASARSHEELEASTELDSGDPAELGRLYGEMKGKLPRFNIVGGCCGTDATHIDRICELIVEI